LFDSKQIAQEIITEVDGTTGEISFVEDKLANSNDKKYFVELNVVGSKLLHEKHTEKDLIASYCASQLYKRLDPKTVEKNFGYNILFDSENDFTKPRRYFYEKEELSQAWKAFDNIDKYLNYLRKGEMTNASLLIDTGYFYINIDSVNGAIKQLLGMQIVKTLNLFKHYEYENRAQTKKMSCFAIVAIVAFQDGSQVPLKFIIPIRELDNKIIMVKA